MFVKQASHNSLPVPFDATPYRVIQRKGNTDDCIVGLSQNRTKMNEDVHVGGGQLP